MPEQPDLKHFQALLLQRAAELDALLQNPAGRAQEVELDQSKVGRLSRMDALQQQAMTDAIRQRSLHERERIQLALKRLQQGEYGYCVQCGEAIAAGRLNFDPATPTCIACASLAERT
jgi:DnaK suppressor protein